MSRRRNNGEATIQRHRSKWRAGMRIEGKRVWGPVVERKSDALPALKQKLGKLFQSAGNQESVLCCLLRTVEDQERTGAIKQTTANLKRLLIGKHIEGTYLANLPVSAVTSTILQNFIDSIDLGPHSKRNVAGIITTALRTKGIDLAYKSKKPVSRKARVLTVEESDRMLRTARGEQRWLIGFLLQMGLRRGEALGVMHEDRDADGVTLQRQVVRISGALLITTLKTRQSETWVPLPKWMQRYVGKGEGFILKDNERPRTPDWVNRTVAEIAERAGIGKVTPHDLRRTAAMGLLESGVDIRTAAEILRHDPAVLATIYAKSRRDLKRAAISAYLERKVPQKVSHE